MVPTSTVNEDGGTPTPVSRLVVTPSVLRLTRVGTDAQVVARARVERADGEPVPSLGIRSTEGWLLAESSPAKDGVGRELTITVNTSGLTEGSYRGILEVSAIDGSATSTSASVGLEVVRGLHIGATPSSCTRPGSVGSLRTDCDFSGLDGLRAAVAVVRNEPHHLLLYSDGQPVQFRGPFDLPADTHLSAAGGVDRSLIEVYAEGNGSRPTRCIRLTGPNVQIRNLSLIIRNSCDYILDDRNSFGGHLIENVVGYASGPEVVGTNGTLFPFNLGSNSLVRNSFFYGYFEADALMQAQTQWIGNTFVFFQDNGLAIRGTDHVVVTDNVFVWLSPISGALIAMGASTSSVTVQGNLAEGPDQAVSGLDMTDSSNRIRDNLLAPAELLTPVEPRFLFDSGQRGLADIPRSGVSIDGVVLDGRTGLRPGAFQVDAPQGLPRSSVVRVGERGGCGTNPCDVLQDEDNEIQRAVWKSWGGSTIEIYPAAEAYAGNAVTSWGLQIRGMGASPTEVVLQSKDEDIRLLEHGSWPHQAILTHTRMTREPITVENLSFRVDSEQSTNEYAIRIESGGPRPTQGINRLRRLVVDSTGADPGFAAALLLGTNTVLQDTLVHGPFGACVRLGDVRSSSNSRTTPNTVHVVNVTCRLEDTLENPVSAVFQVASTTGSQFANIAVDVDAPVPFFQAQRRPQGDMGVRAADRPNDFVAIAVSARGHGSLFDGFDTNDGTYTVNIDSINDPFFAGPTNSRLADPVAHPGIDPLTLGTPIAPGISLNGILRTEPLGGGIDRGAYEQ